MENIFESAEWGMTQPKVIQHDLFMEGNNKL